MEQKSTHSHRAIILLGETSYAQIYHPYEVVMSTEMKSKARSGEREW